MVENVETVAEPAPLPKHWNQARLAKLAFGLVAAGLIANLAFNLVMAKLGFGYPYSNFLFRPNDLWADFFKLAFSYPGDPLHGATGHWLIQPLIDTLKAEADRLHGTSINPDHLPPLPTLLALLVRRAFSLFDPVLVFLFCGWLGLFALVSTLGAFAERGKGGLCWIGVGLFSYPMLFLADRGHFFSLICGLSLISGTRRMVESRRINWQALLLLAIACNLRPNVVVIPAILVLGGQAGRFRDLIWIGLCGAFLLGLSMLAAHLLYPHYGPQAWMDGLRDYNDNYIKHPLAVGFVTSLPSLLNMLLGFNMLWSVVCAGLAAMFAGVAVLAARARLLSIGQVLFLALGLMVIAIPSYADYHLLPFLLPVLVIGTSGNKLDLGDWLAFLASIALLVPKNYVYGNDDYFDAWSYQIIINPLIVLGAMAAILVIALKGRLALVRGKLALVSGELAKLGLARRA